MKPSTSTPSLVRRYAWLTALRWLPIGLSVPVMVLAKQARGLDIVTIGQLMALYSVITVVLELPTGGLADVVGRRGVLIVASLSSAASLCVLGLARSAALAGGCDKANRSARR